MLKTLYIKKYSLKILYWLSILANIVLVVVPGKRVWLKNLVIDIKDRIDRVSKLISDIKLREGTF